MKKKILGMFLLGMLTTQSIFASPKPTKDYFTVIDQFINSYKYTDAKKLKSIIIDEAVITSNRNDKVIKHSAEDIIKFMKANAGTVQQDCSIGYTILSKTDAIVMARVDITYNVGNQQNYLIIEKNSLGDWKITNIYKFHLQNDEKPEIPKRPMA